MNAQDALLAEVKRREQRALVAAKSYVQEVDAPKVSVVEIGWRLDQLRDALADLRVAERRALLESTG